MNRSYPYLILGFVAWFLGASPTPAVGDVRYTIAELPMSRAWAINDPGVVVGEVGSMPARWHDGQLERAPGDADAGPWDVNNTGVVVGGYIQAYVWEGDTRTPLPTLGGVGSAARGINEAGQIVGWLGNSATDTRGCIWYQGQLTLLGALGGGGQQAWPYAINEAGDIVGQAETGPPGPYGAPRQAFLYRQGVMQPIANAASVARDINDLAQIVGKADSRPFLWEDGEWDYLPYPPLAGGTTEALAINNHGQIVGFTSWGEGRAVLWEGGVAHDLINLIDTNSDWTVLERATDINDAGQIVGWGQRQGTSIWRAFLLTPVPEPTVGALLFIGTLLGQRRRAW